MRNVEGLADLKDFISWLLFPWSLSAAYIIKERRSIRFHCVIIPFKKYKTDRRHQPVRATSGKTIIRLTTLIE